MRYSITDAGREELERWFDTPVVNARPAARRAGDQARPRRDGPGRRRRPRSSSASAPPRSPRCRTSPGSRRAASGDLSWSLVLESMRFQLEAEIRWLDHCEASLAAQHRTATTTSTTTQTTDGRSTTSEHTGSGGDDAATPALEIIDVSRIHGRGDAAVHALRGLHLTRDARRAGGGHGALAARASRPCSTSPAGSTRRPPDGCACRGRSSARSPRAALAKVRRRRVGYVFQDYNLIPSLTAAENVALPLELDRVADREAIAQARAALDEVGLGGALRPVPRRPLRRPAAADRDRPGRGRRAQPDPRRRADRRPRLRDRRARARPAARPLRRRGRRAAGDPRGTARRLGRPRRVPPRRRRRRRGRQHRSPPTAFLRAGRR